MKLILGSAQFGFKYGINKKKITKFEFKKISKIIQSNSLTFFDTSMNYGDSERRIGKIKIKKKIITKIKLPKKKLSNLRLWFNSKLQNSLNRLKVEKLHGLLFHDTADILKKKNDFLDIVLKSKKNKKITKVGISVYEIKEINQILKIWKPDIIQIPLNIFDQRFLKSNLLKKLKRLKIEVHVRSCFLQGILLQKNIKQNANFLSKRIFKNYINWCKINQITQLTACLHFVRKIKYIDYLIVGFDESNHLKEILRSFKKKLVSVPNDFAINELNLIDPRKWQI